MKKILLILLFLSISGCASITGSKNQELFEEFNSFNSKFNDELWESHCSEEYKY